MHHSNNKTRLLLAKPFSNHNSLSFPYSFLHACLPLFEPLEGFVRGEVEDVVKINGLVEEGIKAQLSV